MSLPAVKWALQQRAGPSEFGALIRLAKEANSEGVIADLTIRDLAAIIECDKSTVSRLLDKLRDRGLLECRAGSGKGSSTYRLPIPSRS